MKTRLFRFFDQSPYGLKPVFWIHGGRLSPAVTKAYGSDKWAGPSENYLSAEALADFPRFSAAWNVAWEDISAQAKARGDLIYMDMEHIPCVFENGLLDYKLAIAAAKIVRKNCPGIKLTCYDARVGDLVNNDWAILYDQGKTSAEFNANFKASVARNKPLIELLDVLDLPTYLLGAGCYDRDMAYFAALRRVYKKLYPNKPIICSAWGRYHDAWNKTPEEYTVSPERLKAYANQLTRNGDDVIVFAEESPLNDQWIAYLKAKSE